jgi:hypothetical protein
MIPDARTAFTVILVVGLVLGSIAFAPMDLSRNVFVQDSCGIEFGSVASERGLDYRSQSGKITRGGGVFVTDYNEDGWPDVLLVGGTSRRTEYGWAGIQPTLFKNTGGAFERSGELPEKGYDERILSALFFDYDNDGWKDLLLLPVSGEPIFLENREGSFERTEVGIDANLSEPPGAAVADYDRDGDPDLFIYQNGDWADRQPVGFSKPNQSVQDDNGNPNLLFENTGDDFRRVESSGITGARWTLAASFVDFTGDGYPDIHVANDYNADYLYVNKQDGMFEQRALGPQTRRNAMSSEIADVNGDGRLDVFVTNIYLNRSGDAFSAGPYGSIRAHLGERIKGNNLLINRGNGSFVDRADQYSVQEGGWGWAAAFVDFENDGDQDVIHTTQYFRESLVGNRSYFNYPAVFERTNDTSFEPRQPADLGFEVSDGSGLAHLDFDRDGDQDLLLGEFKNSPNPRFKLYENTGCQGNWIQVAVEGNEEQTALGTRVSVTVDGETRVQVLNSKSDFHSQDTRVLHFGLGESEAVNRVTVSWPDGTEQTIRNVSGNQRIVVTPDDTAEENST